MPGYDATGPLGWGPRTGRGFGFCYPGYGPAGPYGWYGRGVGRGGFPWGGGRGRAWGGGRGWAWRAMAGWNQPYWGAYPPPQWGWHYENVPYSDEEEQKYLEEQLSMLQNEMESIRSRLDELAVAEKEGKKTKK